MIQQQKDRLFITGFLLSIFIMGIGITGMAFSLPRFRPTICFCLLTFGAVLVAHAFQGYIEYKICDKK